MGPEPASSHHARTTPGEHHALPPVSCLGTRTRLLPSETHEARRTPCTLSRKLPRDPNPRPPITHARQLWASTHDATRLPFERPAFATSCGRSSSPSVAAGPWRGRAGWATRCLLTFLTLATSFGLGTCTFSVAFLRRIMKKWTLLAFGTIAGFNPIIAIAFLSYGDDSCWSSSASAASSAAAPRAVPTSVVSCHFGTISVATMLFEFRPNH